MATLLANFGLLLYSCVALASLPWVYFDAAGLCARAKIKSPGLMPLDPIKWTLGCLLAYPMVFPLYLFKRLEARRDLVRTEAIYDQLPDEYKWKS